MTMQPGHLGAIQITDWQWFQFLSAQGELDEVNFWRPSDKSRPGWPDGTPVIFKLRQKHGGHIVGYGFFSTHSLQPAWVAWETLERRNGAASFAEFHGMLSAIRGSKGIESDPAGNYEIGCIMLTAPVFLEPARWIVPPVDWPLQAVQGKGYDILQGEGERVWRECLAATPRALTPTAESGIPLAQGSPRYGEPTLVSRRLGQGAFQFVVADAYGRACAITNEHSRPVLEAAHIKPYAENGPHSVPNGLLLRSDIHRLFDWGYVTVSPDDRRFVVSRRLKDDYENGKTYYALQGTVLQEPRVVAERPAREYLEWHAQERFRG